MTTASDIVVKKRRWPWQGRVFWFLIGLDIGMYLIILMDYLYHHNETSWFDHAMNLVFGR